MLLLVESLLYVYLRVYDILRHHSRVIILNYYNPFPISLEEEYTHDDSQVGIYNTTNPLFSTRQTFLLPKPIISHTPRLQEPRSNTTNEHQRTRHRSPARGARKLRQHATRRSTTTAAGRP